MVLAEIADLLKRLLAVSFAQDSSPREESGSIVLECDRDGVELLSALHFLNEIAHFGLQGFEMFWLLILLDRRKNLCLQWLPAWRLTHAGSQLRLSGLYLVACRIV